MPTDKLTNQARSNALYGTNGKPGGIGTMLRQLVETYKSGRARDKKLFPKKKEKKDGK